MKNCCHILADDVISFAVIDYFYLYFNGTFFSLEKLFGK
jgi:hypothetical protein